MKKNIFKILTWTVIAHILSITLISAQGANKKTAVIAYYSAGPAEVDSFNANQLTHIIFSFGHLKGSSLHIQNAKDTLTVQKWYC